MNPTRLALRRPVTVTMLVLALVLMGIISYTFLPVQQLPTISTTFLAVVVSYPGASPEDVEQSITQPLENAVSNVAGVQSMTGLSATGTSRVLLQFVPGTDVKTAANNVAQYVNRVQGQLPTGASAPTVFSGDPNATPIMNLALTGGSQEGLYDTATNIMQPSLQQVSGVASVSVQGGLVPQVSVFAKPAALETYGVALSQIAQAINSQNVSVPGGVTTEGGKVLTIRTNAYYQSIDDLNNLVITTSGGQPVLLKQLATVSSGYANVDQLTNFNGNPAVGMVITAQSGANIVQVDQDVKTALAKVNSALPPGMSIHIINDQTAGIKESLLAVQKDLLLAVMLPAIVLLLFLHRVRNMLVVVVAIPTSLISAFIVMYFLGFSLDLVSLLALSLLTGILVDDSVVVLENINRHLAMGKHPIRAAVDGRMEIGLAAVAITLTDVVVYVPIAFTSGLVGAIFREFGLTIVAATLFSLFVSFTITPLLASRLLKEPLDEQDLLHGKSGGPIMRFGRVWERTFYRMRDGYVRLVTSALRHRPWVLLIGVGSVLLSLAFIPLGILGTEFTPQEDNSQFSVSINMPIGTPLAQTLAIVTAVDAQLRALPGVTDTYASAGSRGGFGGGGNTTSGNIAVDLGPVGSRSALSVYQARVLQLSKQYPGASIVTFIPNSLRVGGERGVSVSITGPDINVLDSLANQVAGKLSALPNVQQVRNEAAQPVPELGVKIDRLQAANLGVNANQIGSAVAAAVGGTTAGYLRPNGSTLQTPIVISLAGATTFTPEQLGQIPVATAAGGVVPLNAVASLYNTSEPSQLNDQNRQLVVGVSMSEAQGVPLGQATADVVQAMSGIAFPDGYSYSLGGAAQQQQQVFAPLLGAFVLSIILVYMLTSALYESFLYPLAVLFSLPLATVGALAGLVLTGNTLNLYSFMGMIMLTGLVAKNAILLIDYTNTLRSRGLPRNEAIIEAGRIRLRPIIMTTSTMVCAMTPLAVKIGAGAESRSPMAVVLIGGLISSTLLTLIFVPTVYSLLDDLGNWLTRRGLRGTPATVGRRYVDEILDGIPGPGISTPTGANRAKISEQFGDD